jgi:hypothetical protein
VQIDACKELAVMVRTSMGPNGMNKMVINHLERLFVTSDARTIVTELEVQHPAGTRRTRGAPSAVRCFSPRPCFLAQRKF